MLDTLGRLFEEPLVRGFAAVLAVLLGLFLYQFGFGSATFDVVVPDGGVEGGAGTPDTEVSTTGGIVNGSARREINESLIARYVREFVNEARVKRGRHPLTRDAALADVAQAHSEDMAHNGYLGHRDRRGWGPTRRANEMGYRCITDVHYGIGENVARTYFRRSTLTITGERAFYADERELARGVVRQWLHSEGHREAMLATFFNREGTGVAVTHGGAVYVTQAFC